MRTNRKPDRPMRGFTLVEMAIVLLIIGLLLAGMLLPLGAQVDQRKYSETQKAMDEINQALLGFAVINGRLPCPATPAIASGGGNAGIEACNGGTYGNCNQCASSSGVLPWGTLGVSETDAWGWRYTYRVTSSFADAIAQNTFTPPVGCIPTPTPAQSSFALCSQGDNTILATSGGTAMAANVPAVIVSHGKNGFGAYTTAGAQLGGAAGDELENANGDGNFVGKGLSDNFDDLVTWISPNLLLNRMVATGKLP